MVIEDERGSVKHPKQEPDGPEEVRWIATLDDGEATAHARSEAEEQGGDEGVDVLENEG